MAIMIIKKKKKRSMLIWWYFLLWMIDRMKVLINIYVFFFYILYLDIFMHNKTRLTGVDGMKKIHYLGTKKVLITLILVNDWHLNLRLN